MWWRDEFGDPLIRRDENQASSAYICKAFGWLLNLDPKTQTFPPKTNRPCLLFLYYSTSSFQQQAIMLKFTISLMRKIVHTIEANVPPARIMAKLPYDNNVLRNNMRKLVKHQFAPESQDENFGSHKQPTWSGQDLHRFCSTCKAPRSTLNRW